MHDAEDVQPVLKSIRGGLETMSIYFLRCAVHVLDMDEPPTLRTYRSQDFDGISKRGEWVLADAESAAATIVEIWRQNNLSYRPDLLARDTYGEKAHLQAEYGDVRALVDVLFSPRHAQRQQCPT